MTTERAANIVQKPCRMRHGIKTGILYLEKKMTTLIKYQKNNTLFVMCSCANEILILEHDKQDNSVYLSIYDHYNSHLQKLTLYQKMNYIWNILWNKKIYGDQIVLEKDQLLEVKNFINLII